MDTIVTRVNLSPLQLHDQSHQLLPIHLLVISVPQVVLGLLSTMEFATQNVSTRHVDTMVTIATKKKMTCRFSPRQRNQFCPSQSHLVMTAVPLDVLGLLSTMEFVTKNAITRNVEMMVTIATK